MAQMVCSSRVGCGADGAEMVRSGGMRGFSVAPSAGDKPFPPSELGTLLIFGILM